MRDESIKILGVKVDNLSASEAKERLLFYTSQKKPALITTPNTEMIVMAASDPLFLEILNEKSKLNLADGAGLLWAAKFLSLKTPRSFLAYPLILLQWIQTILFLPVFPKFFSKPLKARLSGADFIWDITRLAAENKLKLFLLGGAATVAERTALRLQTEIPELRVAGVHSGTPNETPEIIDSINRSRADILLVCFGPPKQEKWLSQNLSKTCAKIGIGLGGTFDFISGECPRAPKKMQRAGLEWLYRLFLEPYRIKRQLSIPKFMWLVLLEKFKQVNQSKND